MEFADMRGWAGDIPLDIGIIDFLTFDPPAALPGDFAAESDHPGGTTVPRGFLEVFDGSATQQVGNGTNTQAPLWSRTQNRMMTATPAVDGRFIPGLRNQAAVCLYEMFVGSSPQVPSFSFEVASFTTRTGLFPSHLADDACPISVIHDVLTSPWSKLNLPESRIDTASFAVASATLFAESHGYSRVLDQAQDAVDIIDDVLRQVDGVMYEEPATGKFVIKLVRQDYDIDDLDELNPDNVINLENFAVGGWQDIINEVRVTFTDRSRSYQDGTARAQNHANAVGQGNKLRVTTMQFAGCCEGQLAARLASRELGAVSRPSVKANVVVNREFHLTRPGDVLALTWPELGLVRMPMRVACVDLGQLYDGKISLSLIHDIFGKQWIG
ncbi:MAG: phage tail protein [Kofleriaceae bacterium]